MGSDELAARIAAALRDGPEPLPGAVLLERHGAYAVGPDARAAVDRLELLEVLCRTWRDALLLRAARRGWTRPSGEDPRSDTVRPTSRHGGGTEWLQPAPMWPNCSARSCS